MRIALSLFFVSFGLLSCKQPAPQERAPEQTQAPLNEPPAEPLTITLPETPPASPRDSENPPAGPKKHFFNWNLQQLRGAGAAKIQSSVDACAASFSIDNAEKSGSSITPWLLAYKSCEAARQISRLPCQDKNNKRSEDCSGIAFRARLMHSLVNNDSSSCASTLESLAPYSFGGGKPACEQLFNAHRSGSASPLADLAKSAGGRLSADQFFWIFGTKKCEALKNSPHYNQEECQEDGALFDAVAAGNASACGQKTSCVTALSLNQKSPCENYKAALEQAFCLQDLQTAATGSSIASEAFLGEISRMLQKLKTPR